MLCCQVVVAVWGRQIETIVLVRVLVWQGAVRAQIVSQVLSVVRVCCVVPVVFLPAFEWKDCLRVMLPGMMTHGWMRPFHSAGRIISLFPLRGMTAKSFS